MVSISQEFLTAAQVRHRYGGVSKMWIARRIADAGFPEPVRLGMRVRHFRLADVEAWERDRARASARHKMAVRS